MHSFITFLNRLKCQFLVLLVTLMASLSLTPAVAADDLSQKIAAKKQLTNLATIYLTVPDALNADGTAKPINEVLYKTGNVAEYHAATIQVVDNGTDGTNRPLENFTDSNLQIKVRGNSTAGDAKKPYRLKFGKDEKDAAGNVITSHKHDMLGSGYRKRNWTLLTNHKDPSMLRNAITYHVGQAVGMPFCPGYKFVDLVINGEYRGTYQISDHCEVGSNRIELDDEATGWFIESARGDMVEEPKVEAGGLQVSIKNPEPATDAEIATLKTQVGNYIKNMNSYIGMYSTACSEELFRDPVNGWRSVIDEESFVKFYIGINLTDDYDGFMTVKMYRDVNGKMKFGPLWDKDLAYGNWDNHGILCEEYQTGYTFSYYAQKLATDPVFIKKVHDRFHAIIEAGYATTIKAKLAELQTMLTESQALNQKMWWTSADYPADVKKLSDYIDTRVAYLTTTIDKMYNDAGGDAIVDNPTGGDSGEGGSGTTEHAEPHEFTLGEWQNVLLPSDTFHPNATKATFTVTGASYIRLLNSDDEYDIVSGYVYSWNAANQAGVTFDISGDVLTKAKAGQLYIRTGGGSPITLSITCTIPEGSGEGGGDTPTTRQQLTNLPTIYLDATVGDDWSTATLEVFDADNKLTQGATWTSSAVSVQYQGGHSEGTKDSYRLKFDSKTKLLASGKFKQWVLASNDDDPSLINNAMAKELGDLVGMPFTPGYQFVDLYVNNTYMGTYQVTDRIKTESGRAMVTGGNKDNDWHVRINDNDEITEGGYTTDEYVVATSSMPNLVIKNPDPDDLAATALATLKNDMTTWFSSFFTKTNGHYANVESNVDKQQIINWYICQEVLAIYKGLSSVEAYRSITTGAADQTLHFGPLWDNETAFGNRGDEDAALSMADLTTANSYNGLLFNYNKYDLMKSFIEDLWTQDWFKAGVPAKWKSLVDAGLLATLKSKATSISATLEQSQAKNLEKWTNSLKTKNKSYSNYADAVSAISTYLDERVPYLTKKFNALGSTCTNHTYTEGNYVYNGDGTYSPTCDNCGTANTGVKTHRFTVYHQGGTKEELYQNSWTHTAGTNDVATIEKAANISGENIIQMDGKTYTCAIFVLTDGQPFYYGGEKSFTATDATYKRNISNEWGTICMPFKAQAATTEYASFYHLDEASSDVLTFRLIDPASGAGAYKPLVFRATAKALQEGKIVVTGTDITVKATTAEMTNSTVTGWTLNGTVINQTIDGGAGIYYIASNQFWLAEESFTLPPFRAYITSSTASGANYRIATDGEALGIEEVIDVTPQADQIFDLQGRHLAQPQQGINIINGKKVIVK